MYVFIDSLNKPVLNLALVSGAGNRAVNKTCEASALVEGETSQVCKDKNQDKLWHSEQISADEIRCDRKSSGS